VSIIKQEYPEAIFVKTGQGAGKKEGLRKGCSGLKGPIERFEFGKNLSVYLWIMKPRM